MENNTTPELFNMFSLSETRPELCDHLISREQYLSFLDGQMEEHKVLCVDGVEGVGVTTTLALFARRHSENCASYFNNGWSRHLLNPQTIVRSLLRQLSYYTQTELDPKEEENTLANCIFRITRQTRNKNKYIFFVLDGFSNLPAVYVDGIKGALAPLFSITNSRFLFSGDKEEIARLLPEGIMAKQTNEILKFQLNDIEGYLKEIDPDLQQPDIETIYELSGKGLARRLAILTEKLQLEGLDKIREYDRQMKEDFFEEDFDWIENQKDQRLSLLMALLTFSEIPLTKVSVVRTLKMEDGEIDDLIEKCQSYIKEEGDSIFLRSNDFRKYLHGKLAHLKTDIELLLIDVIEKSSDIGEQFVYLPALYKHVKDNKQLVDYLTSANVQRYLENKKSQAALNEQCEYGYNACRDFETQAAAYFRFSINRSVSREIEKNELSDSEIEALIAVGDDETAFALTQSVFLMEERLKCLLIIAQAGQHLSDAMKEEIDRQITMLADTIDFEHIPNKALELAKLMLPVKMEKALEIIDKVAKVTKDPQRIDRLYTAISISFNNEGKSDDAMARKADIVSTKIEDDGLRKMAGVMKSIMKESSAEQVVSKMRELPTAGSQLYFMQYWIPNHKMREDVGEVVEYAVRLVIDTSQTTMPKVTLLKLFCKPLPDMPEKQVQTVVGLLDAVIANIKYPTVEYVKLQLLVISALVKYNKSDAENRLQALYLEILEFKDKALQAHCKALLLRNYDKLGDPNDVEGWISPAKDLEKEVLEDISEVLKDTAYHLKVVEGPIAALVCSYPEFVKEVIAKMNTAERQSKAYMQATQEYVWQTDIKRMDWKYFNTLFHHITYDTTELYKPLHDLVNKITEVNDKDSNLLEKVKKNYELLKRVDQAEEQCYYFAKLYVWLRQNYEDEDFQQKVKKDLDTVWNLISIPSLKVETGYQIAKVLSTISMKIEAREYVAKAAKVRENQLLSSISCLEAYEQSFEMYAHSLGILIRSGLCSDEDIDQFRILMDYDGSDSEAIILWSRVALEYYGVNDMERFQNIMNKYVSTAIEKPFSTYDLKRVLFHIAPALYLNSSALFYGWINKFDVGFSNACIECVARYIQTKYPYPEYTSTNEIENQIPLEKKDYDNLLDLMKNSKDDGFVFSLTSTMTQSIKRNFGNKLSREMQRVLWDGLTRVVNDRLPMEGGIQHKGYKIACLTMIEGTKTNGSINIEQLKRDIENIENNADQAFLYAHMANYLKRTSEKQDFIDLAVKKTENIDYTFDKFNRYTLCLQDSYDAAKTKSPGIAKKMMESLKKDKNGSYSDYQRMLDLVRDHDEQLADTMLEMVDDDPARVQYKTRLNQRIASSKKIDAARSDMKKVNRLNNKEQMRFFEKQMEYLIKKKSIIKDIDSTQPILALVYESPISDMRDAVLYFMENLFLKNQSNKKYNSLLREIHMAIVDNIKIVLAIASGTQEKLSRVNRIMNERSDKNEGFIPVGEGDKGVRRIVDWYKEHPVDILRIIDPYFFPEDLYIIKALMDLNNSLNCSILTNHEKEEPLNDAFQNGWNTWSAELPGRIEIKTCCYSDQPKKSPWHDRWWLLYNPEKDEYFGIRMASPSTLGSRITEISEMDNTAVCSAMRVFDRFFVNMVPKYEDRKLRYEETKLH